MKNYTVIANCKKTVLLAICVVIAFFALSTNSVAHAADDEIPYVPTNDETVNPADLGSAIWMSADGITHTSDGLAWGLDGVVYGESEVETDLGPAIWMDPNGITHTSDGLAWGPDGVVYFEGTSDDTFCVTHGTSIGTAIWCDELGNIHDLGSTCFINLSVEDNGTIVSSIAGMDLLFECDTVVATYYLSATNSILFQVLAADTHVELLAIVVTLPM